MKLQIEGQSLRVRIGEVELASLLVGQPVVSSTRFTRDMSLSCTLRAVAGAAARFSGLAGAWSIDLPEDALRAYAGTLPSREGLTFELESGDGEPLELLFDVDVRDSVRHRRTK
ncbi:MULTISPECIES: DUF7009 family protein [Dyella]|uniref:DUF7009 family protein n=1 Tax=Dyella TaxID=231454 RepID=UPI000C83D561|nr:MULTISPECIES: hypothetical protein [Dyella]MDR3446279.1 hypothetical protein [Dyella sp.]PMQ02734.1 hypothetical protein DyAD56_22930 [Dyella sp. AD56]ULU24365.1 hypothetical protein DYST_01280 [Dyella terrae]